MLDPKRNALLALCLIAPAPSLGALMLFWIYPDDPIGRIGYAVGKVWLYGLPLVWLLAVERKRPSLSPARRGGLGIGAFLGLLIGAVILAAYYLYARDRIDPEVIRTVVEANQLGEPWRYILGCIWFAVVNAALEEYAFRWFIYEKCEQSVGRAVPASDSLPAETGPHRRAKPALHQLLRKWAAVVLAALIFTVHHTIVVRAYFGWDLTILASAGVFIGGGVWSWCYLRYRSIWPGYVSHIIADLAIFIVGWELIFGW